MGLGSILGTIVGGPLMAHKKNGNSNATTKAQAGSSASGQAPTSGPSAAKIAGEQLSTLGSQQAEQAAGQAGTSTPTGNMQDSIESSQTVGDYSSPSDYGTPQAPDAAGSPESKYGFDVDPGMEPILDQIGEAQNYSPWMRSKIQSNMYDMNMTKGTMAPVGGENWNNMSPTQQYVANFMNNRELTSGMNLDTGSGAVQADKGTGLGLNVNGLKQLNSQYGQPIDTGTDMLDELKPRM